MAHLEIVNFTPMRPVVSMDDVSWKRDGKLRSIPDLPQVFWSNGSPWSEANLWALMKCQGGSMVPTVASLMSHVAAYADWLEKSGLDWRVATQNAADTVLARYKREVLRLRALGLISPSTATVRMRALIQFYRAIAPGGEIVLMPRAKRIALSCASTPLTGYVTGSALAIPIEGRRRLSLEDGVQAMRPDQVLQLMRFTASEGLHELNLILSLGFLSGAPSRTITSLKKSDVSHAKRVPGLRGVYQIAVGPGTEVPTRDDVPGSLYVPHDLLEALKAYVESQDRLKRLSRAHPQLRDLLFLTVRGNPYKLDSFNRLMNHLRRISVIAGLDFMESFKFQQTRCTYGLWLMRLTLGFAEQSNAIAFVCSAMLHRTEAITQRYVRYLKEVDPGLRVPVEFSAAYADLANLPVFRHTHTR